MTPYYDGQYGVYLDPRPDWWDSAACLGANPDLFFAHDGGHEARTAKAICAACPVRAECLDDAIDNREAFGVRGGMSPKERRVEARRRRQAS